LMAVAETDTGRALPPAVTFKLVTFTESENSGWRQRQSRSARKRPYG